MSHRLHPAEGDKVDAILFDYCEDCAEKVKNLGIGLDADRWATMWRRMLATEIPGQETSIDRGGYRSRNEKDLGVQMYQLYVLLERRGMYFAVKQLSQ